MDEHEELKQKLIKEGINDPDVKRDFLEISNGRDKLLIISGYNNRTADFFLNGEYVCDINLMLSQKTQKNYIQLFAGYIQRDRDKCYHPLKGYYNLYSTRDPADKPYNPLGLVKENLDVFTELMQKGLIAIERTLPFDNEKWKRAKNLLEWLRIEDLE